MSRPFVALLLVTSAVACTTSRAPDPLDASHLPQLTLTALSRVGGKDERPAYMLSSVTAATVLGPDKWALIDGGSRQVRIYGTDGLVRRVMGGEGNAPGQFSAPRSLGVTADGDLVVWDVDQGRITTFDSAGALVGTATLRNRDPMAIYLSTFVGAFADGSWARQEGISPDAIADARDGPRRDTVRFEHISADGKDLGRIAAVRGPKRFVMHSGGRSGEETPIFGRQLVAAVSGDTLLVGLTDSLRLLRFLPDGTALPPLAFRRPSRRTTRRQVSGERVFRTKRAELLRRRVQGSFPKNVLDQEVSRIVDVAQSVPAERTWPAFGALMVGPGGELWIRDPSSSDDTTTRWIRFNSALRPEGWIELRDQATLLAVGDSLVLVRSMDELGIETVVCYRVAAVSHD